MSTSTASGGQSSRPYVPHTRREHYAIMRRSLELYPDSRICGNCTRRAWQVQLKYCVECRGATYCSRECQRADWKSHRTLCVRLTETRVLLRKMDEANSYLADYPEYSDLINPPPPGLTWVGLHECARKWMIFHEKTLLISTIHALRLPNVLNFTRFRTHIVYICVGWREDNPEKKVGRYFKLVQAEAISRREAAKRWGRPPSFFDAEGTRDDEDWEERNDYDPRELRMRGEPIASIALALECKPLNQMVMIPYSCFLEEIAMLPIINWKRLLEDRVDNGRTF